MLSSMSTSFLLPIGGALTTVKLGQSIAGGLVTYLVPFYVIWVAGSPGAITSVAWPLLNYWVSPPLHWGSSLYIPTINLQNVWAWSCMPWPCSSWCDYLYFPCAFLISCSESFYCFLPFLEPLNLVSSAPLPLPTHHPLVISLTSIVRVWSPKAAPDFQIPWPVRLSTSYF